jgi:predicted ATPase
MMTRLAIADYRSLRDIRVPLGPLNVVTGANGSGKSSLYRGLRLLADIAQGRIIQSLASEGGLQSTLWAGPEAFSRAMKNGAQPVQGLVRKNRVGLKLGFFGTDYGYAIDLGLPVQDSRSKFSSDPEIKVESLWTGERLGRANAFAVRNGPSVRIRNDSGEWRLAYQHLASFDSMMTHCSDPRDGIELLMLRERMRDWRFTTTCAPTGKRPHADRKSAPIRPCWRATDRIWPQPCKPSVKSATRRKWTPRSPTLFPARMSR